MKVLITGGAGFVGRAFTRRLADDGHKVTIVDDLSTGLERYKWTIQPKNLFGFFFSVMDCREWFEHHNASEFELVIHCAAVVGGRLNIEGDPLGVATDLAIDSDLFNWCTQSKTMPRVIYFSSSAAYPIALQTRDNNCDLNENYLHFDGTRVGMPDFSYGWSKLSGEYLAKIAAEKYGLDAKVYRPFGGYGEDQDMTYPFPSIIRRVLAHEDPITIWGSGDQQRDFIHIDDIVEAVLQTMDLLPAGEPLNLGTGRGVSFRNLATMAAKQLMPQFYPWSVTSDPTKPEGVFYRVADTYKLFQYYQPKITLEEGIDRVGRHLARQLAGVDIDKTLV